MRYLSVKWKLVMFFFSIFIPVMFLVFFLQQSFFGIMFESTSKYTAQYIEKILYDIELSLNEIDRCTFSLTYDQDVKELLRDEPTEEKTKHVSNKLNEVVENMPAFNNASCAILLLNKNQKIVASTYDEWTGLSRIVGAEWLNRIIMERGNKVVISGYSIIKGNAFSNVKVISVARAIFENDNFLGTLMVEIPIDYLTKICAGVNLGKNGFVALLDNDNYVIYNTKTDKIGNKFIDIGRDEERLAYKIRNLNGIDMFVVEAISQFSGLRVIGAVPQSELKNDISILFVNVHNAIVVIGIIVFLLLYYFALQISRPIVDMSEAMKKVEKGDFTIRIPKTSYDEIGILQSGFNSMVRKLSELIAREYKSVIREREAELNELMAMINPHFIYNTLEAISMTAYLNEDVKTVEMLGRLADIFRSMTGNRSRFHALKKELELVDNYISLINLRWDNKINVHLDLDQNLMGCKIMKFILQPIVENSIVHGFRDNSKSHNIWIKVSRVNSDEAMITVTDDGSGCSEEQIKKLKALLESNCDDKGCHQMALKNIHDRLRLMYGEKYGVDIRSRPKNTGLVVSVMFLLEE